MITGGRLWWGIPVLLALLWSLGLLSVTSIPGLPSPSAATLWALPTARFVRDVAAAVTVGCLLVGGLLLPRPSTRALRWGVAWAAGWLVALGLEFVLTLSDVRAVTPASALGDATAWTFLTRESVGQVVLAQVAAVMLAALLAWTTRSRVPLALAAAWALAASAAPAFLGHAGMAGGHVAATISLMLHMAAVSAWVGGLITVVALLRLEPDVGPSLLPRFSLMALWCVIVVAETGLLNASLRAGAPSALVGTAYGSLVLAKAVLLGWLVRLGWLQRTRTLPGMADDSALSLAHLVRLAGWEAVAMGVAFGVSVTLARLGPTPTGATAGPFSPLPVVLLALAFPLLLATSFPRRHAGAWARGLAAYPEVPAAALLVVVVEVAGVGAIDALLGVEAGAIVGSAILVAVGWAWAVATLGGRSVSAVVIVMAGWPLVAWFSSLLAGSSQGWRPGLLSLVLAEALLVTLLVRIATQSRSDAAMPVAVAG